VTGAGQLREHLATVVVAALSSWFAATLILFTGILTAAMDPRMVQESATFRIVLLMVVGIFIVIALYVGAIVTANTFATIIAGRLRTIALLRLVGASAARVRARVASEGLVMGALGSVLGLLLAEGLCLAAVAFGPAWGWLPAGRDYPIFDPLALGAVVVVVLTTYAAAWVGSRPVGRVSPVEATGAAVEPPAEVAHRRTARTVWSIVLLLLGVALIALGLLIGMFSPLGLFISFVGGLSSFTGIALGAHWVMPPVLALAGRLLERFVGGRPVVRLATANAVRFPDRSARSTIGLVIGVTLVVMFAVALDSYRAMTLLAFANDPQLASSLDQTLSITTAIFTGLVGFSAVIAAVGMVNTLSLGVLQRRRELGLLRALGFTGQQVRRMVVAESAQMTLAALGFGLLLGIFYGWVAAQSLLGSQAGLSAPTVPWPVLAGVAVFGVALAAAAAAAPARRAVRMSPMEVLAAE